MPVKEGRVGTCTSSYVCEWDDCYANPDCADTYCCELAVSPTKTTTYGCVKEGTIKDSKYLCDPPSWNYLDQQKENLLVSIVKILSQIFRI
jgi:hypothetical protein